MSNNNDKQIVVDYTAYRLLKKRAFENDERMKAIASSIIKKALDNSKK